MILLKIILFIFILVMLPEALGICVFPECGIPFASRSGKKAGDAAGSAGDAAGSAGDAAGSADDIIVPAGGGERSLPGFLKCMLTGCFLMWAVFQAVAVPCSCAGTAFHTVILLWAACLALILVICTLKRRILPVFPVRGKTGAGAHAAGNEGPGAGAVFVIAMVAAAVLILIQCAVYFAGMHIDEDDSRYLAEAVDAWENDRIYAVYPQSGSVRSGAWTGDFIKDIVSPWPLWIAAVSKLLMTHPAVTAHMVYSPYLLLIFYAAVYLTGRELFRDSREKPVIFVALSAFILMFFAGSLRTTAEFTLLRIWQGKAVFAAIGVASLLLEFMMLYRYAEKPGYGRGEKKIFLLVLLTEASCCLMSGMGVVLSLVMVGAFALWYLLAYRRLKGFLILLLDCLPGIAMGVMTILMRGTF